MIQPPKVRRSPVLCNFPSVFISGLITFIMSTSFSISIISHIIHHSTCFNVTTYETKAEIKYSLYKCKGLETFDYHNTTEDLCDNALFFHNIYMNLNDYMQAMLVWLVISASTALSSPFLMFSSYIRANCCVGTCFIFPWIASVFCMFLTDIYMFYNWIIRYQDHTSLYFTQLWFRIDYETIQRISERHKMKFISVTEMKIGLLSLKLTCDVIYFFCYLCVCLYWVKHFCVVGRHSIKPIIIRTEAESVNIMPGKSILKDKNQHHLFKERKKR